MCLEKWTRPSSSLSWILDILLKARVRNIEIGIPEVQARNSEIDVPEVQALKKLDEFVARLLIMRVMMIIRVGVDEGNQLRQLKVKGAVVSVNPEILQVLRMRDVRRKRRISAGERIPLILLVPLPNHLMKR